MKRASLLVTLSAIGILLIPGCATNDEPGAPSSSSAYSSTPSSSATSSTSSAPPPSPAPVTETVAPPPVATQTPTETVAPPTQGSGLPSNLDRDGDGIQDEGAVGGGDTDDALCNDPNLADWAATSPTCQ
ncbi:hypothetical protein ABLE94_00845 [Gordonia sp. VNK1]|uniref:hypothetical protein n=1 Tax=Gordonia oleivorans TaxID=3156618 RepID=UPI0032B3A9CE